MKKHEILEVLQGLAKCQGMYGRMLEALENNGTLDDALQFFEDQNFKEAIDLIMFIEN